MNYMSDQKIELSVPAAIIIAGMLIAFSIFISKTPVADTERDSITIKDKVQDSIEPVTGADVNMRAVSSDDHIRGFFNAPVKIVEFSDPECPFCKKFHNTMKQVMEEYGKSGKVAWVYRHFPLDQLHSKARKEAEAIECASELGGNKKFWEYVDRLMEITPSNNQLNPVKLQEIAEYIGLDKKKFETCLSSGKYAEKIQGHVDDAVSAGGRGTPYTVVVGTLGRKFPVDGAVPYESLKETIEQALRQGKGVR